MPWATAGFNKLYQTQYGAQRSGNVFYPNDVDELVGAMQYSVNTGRSFSVMSGGHGYEGYGTSGDIVINMGALQAIEELEKNGRQYITVEGGAPLLKVYGYTFNRHGTIIPGGSCYSVCAGGHITGGGYGLYSRMFGLTVDFVAGVQFAWVNGDGKVRLIDAFHDSNETELQELVWACRGASAGNFGVIVKYYLDKEKMAMNAPPLTFHQVVVTIVPFDKIPHHDDANNGATLYNKIWQTYWNYYKSPDNDPTTFGFLRANKDGITLFASSGSHEGLYEYIRLFVTVLSDYDPSGTLLQYITVDHGRGAGYGDGGGSSQVIGVPVDATGTSGQPTGITGITGFTMDKLSAQFDSYNFFDYVQINDGADPNSYFKNSGHVIREDAGGGAGYTQAQTDVIFDHTLQAYTLANESETDNIKSMIKAHGLKKLINMMPNARVIKVRNYVSDAAHGPASEDSKPLYLVKAKQNATDARPQWGWISQHQSPTAAQRAKGIGIKDYNVHYTYQHDPYNGKVMTYTEDNPLPAPGMPLHTSVSNRMHLVKVQPQLYWDYKHDSPYMIEWFDSFTNSLFATKENGLSQVDYPPVNGLYINYPDTYYKEMYPATDPVVDDDKPLKEGEFPTWPSLVYGNGNGKGRTFLPTLQKVKGAFDPLQYFNLKSKKSYETEAKPALGIPPPITKVAPYAGGEPISPKAQEIAEHGHLCAWSNTE
jgi:hypothetical protein